MIKSLLRTDNNSGYTIIRIAFAFVISAHGAQKLLGWFGGYGFEGTMGYFTQTVGVPSFIGALVILGESIGAILLAAGIFSRFIAASLLIIMIGAASMHWPNGFFMNFFNNQPGEGIEYFILASAMALLIAIKGGGAWSLDRVLERNIARTGNR